MSKNTNAVRPDGIPLPRIDEVDRILLGLLARDGTQSYATLGEQLHLSAPAVHERVKRLKREGVIRGVVAQLDPVALGRPLLCFVRVMTNTIARTRHVAALTDLPEVEEVHTVTGDCGLFMKVRTRDMKSLESLLDTIHEVEGVTGTQTQMVLSTLMERGPSPVMDSPLLRQKQLKK